MKKYLVLKEFRPGNVDDLKIVVVDVERVTDDRFEGGISSPQTYWAYARYYWLDFDTAEEAEAYREAAVTRHFDVIEEERDRKIDELTDILKAHKQ